MAEFSELVRIKKRICIKYKSSGCFGCPIDRSMGHLCGIISLSGYSDNEFMELEEALLSWAAENPVPVYPTWMEWLTDLGAIPKAISWDEPLVEAVYDAIQEHIPADIAERLEIKPKEV